jgi:hypothetical protein
VRLVSLLPSATEIVYALGLGDDLAGVTFECDEPPAARADKTIVVGGLTQDLCRACSGSGYGTKIRPLGVTPPMGILAIAPVLRSIVPRELAG